MWKRGRSTLGWLAAIVFCASLPVSHSLAQGYPVKPIRIVVGFAPGGVASAVARLIAEKLAEPLGQQLIVENRPGASSAIAIERVARSPADGYTLLILGATASVLPALRARLPFDLERDLAPVSLVAISPFVLVVHPSVPARNVKELIALARARPGRLNYATVGAGSPPHLMAGLFSLMAKVKLVHVPYKGGGDAAVAVASGEVDMYFSSVPSLLPLFGAGKLRPLAVTSAKRSSSAAELPTLDEAGLPGYDYANWNGVVAPAGVPKDIIARLNAAIGAAVNAPGMNELFKRQGLEPQTSTPEEFAAFIHRQVVQNARLIKEIGLKAE